MSLGKTENERLHFVFPAAFGKLVCAATGRLEAGGELFENGLHSPGVGDLFVLIHRASVRENGLFHLLIRSGVWR